MKNKTLAFLFAVLSWNLHLLASESSVVTFNLHSESYDHVIEIFEPLDLGYNFLVSNEEKTFKETPSSTSYIYRYENAYPANFRITVDNRAFDLILLADDTVQVDIYPDRKTPDWIEFSGANAEGQKLKNEWRDTKGKDFDILVHIFEEQKMDYRKIVEEVEKAVDRKIGILDSIVGTKSVSPTFKTLMKKDVYSTYYFDEIEMFNVILSGKKYGQIPSADSLAIRNIQRQLFEKHNPFCTSNLLSVTGQMYFGLYLRTNEFNSISSKKLLADFGPYNSYGILPDELQKSQLGKAIVVDYVYGVESFDKKKGIDFFSKKFPDSQYLPYIRRFQQKEEQILKDKTKPDFEISIDTANAISTIKTLKELHETYFKGKKIFIDVWATWCLPCKQEFAFASELDSLVKANDITLVFLSIDDLKLKNFWIKNIQNYQLKGYHFLANKSIQKDIFKDQSISIPRYIYMDENGTIITDDAPRPHSMKELKLLFSKK